MDKDSPAGVVHWLRMHGKCERSGLVVDLKWPKIGEFASEFKDTTPGGVA